MNCSQFVAENVEVAVGEKTFSSNGSMRQLIAYVSLGLNLTDEAIGFKFKVLLSGGSFAAA